MRAVLAQADPISFGFHADNCFAYFTSPQQALEAAIALRQAITTSGIQLNDVEPYGIAAGLGFGELLCGSEEDGFFGDEMNLASRLGEDIAIRDEILLTKSAHEALGPRPKWRFEQRSMEASGLRFDYYALVT